jgi:hypothetical protein
MATCPECAQLLAPEVAKCPACGHDLRLRRVQLDEPVAHDDEQDRDELLTAAIVAEGPNKPPPPWVPSLEDRLRPVIDLRTPPELVDGEELGDLVPAGGDRRPFWRRRL